jgi:hypothetical protein
MHTYFNQFLQVASVVCGRHWIQGSRIQTFGGRSSETQYHLIDLINQ